MATFSAIFRPSAALSAAASTRRAITGFARPSAFSFPSTYSAAASRFSRNLVTFRSHYALLLWLSVLAFLFPYNRSAMLFLMAISKVFLSCSFLRRLLPTSSFLLHILDNRILALIFLVVVTAQIALAGAVVDMLLAIAAIAPVIAAHAAFRTLDEPLNVELSPIFEKRSADLESGRSA